MSRHENAYISTRPDAARTMSHEGPRSTELSELMLNLFPAGFVTGTQLGGRMPIGDGFVSMEEERKRWYGSEKVEPGRVGWEGEVGAVEAAVDIGIRSEPGGESQWTVR